MEALGGRGGQLQFRGEGASAPSSSTSCGPVGDERSVSRHRVREGGRVRTRRSNSATRSAPMARALRARAPAASLIAASRGPRSAVRVGLGLVGVRVGVGFGGSGLRHHFTTGRKSRRRRRTALPAGTGTKDTTAPSAESHAESAREADARGLLMARSVQVAVSEDLVTASYRTRLPAGEAEGARLFLELNKIRARACSVRLYRFLPEVASKVPSHTRRLAPGSSTLPRRSALARAARR